MIHNQIKRQLELFDWFYDFSDDPGVYTMGRENKKKLSFLVQEGLKTSFTETDKVIQEFLNDKEEKCNFGDFHFYFGPIKQMYSYVNLTLKR